MAPPRNAAAAGMAPTPGRTIHADDVNDVWKALQPWGRELIARRWIKQSGRYWGSVDVLQNR
eukprot:2527290-Pleurochrysis_carterae.AAC.1